MNVIGTHLRDPLNSGLARWRLAVYMWTPPPWKARGIPYVGTEFGLRVENKSRLAWDGTAEPVSRNQIIRRGEIHIIPCLTDHEQDS